MLSSSSGPVPLFDLAFLHPDPRFSSAPRAGRRLGLKVSAEIKNRLDGAARATGRTQSQEAEARLLHSFDREDLLGEVMTLAFDDRRTADVILAMGHLMHHVGSTRGYFTGSSDLDDHWLDHPDAYREAFEATTTFLRAAQPQDYRYRSPKPNKRGVGRGYRVAHDFLQRLPAIHFGKRLSRRDAHIGPHRRVSTIASLLGSAIKELKPVPPSSSVTERENSS
jgi:hypothetical protein